MHVNASCGSLCSCTACQYHCLHALLFSAQGEQRCSSYWQLKLTRNHNPETVCCNLNNRKIMERSVPFRVLVTTRIAPNPTERKVNLTDSSGSFQHVHPLCCCKSIFVCGNHTGIILTKIIIRRKFSGRILRTSTLNGNDFMRKFLHAN